MSDEEFRALVEQASASLPRNLVQRLEREAPGVSKSILEGLDEILTVTRLGLPDELRDALPPPDFVALAERVLGRESPEYRALLILTRPGISIRERCRELARSRATLAGRLTHG